MSEINMRFDFDYDGLSYREMPAAGLVAAGVPSAIVLGLIKGRLKAAVDVKAETLRASITTPGTGQAMEYLEAQQQAFAALAAPAAATKEKYPMLAASVGIDVNPKTGEKATDVLGVAEAVLAAYAEWNAIGSEIRAKRLAGKKAIDDATTEEAAAAAYVAITWPPLG